MISFSPCPECGGKGKVGPIATDQDTWRFDPCPKCGGLGVEISDEQIKAKARELHDEECVTDCPWPLDRKWLDYARAKLGAVVVAHLQDGTKGTE